MRRFFSWRGWRYVPLLLMAVGLVALGMWLLPQLRAPRGRTYVFYVEDTTGLPAGTEVKFRGLVVGQVTRVTLDEERTRQRGSPWFEVGFQAEPEGEKLFKIWSFHGVTLEKETPLIGATVVMLSDARMPGGRTPDVLEMWTLPQDDFAGDLRAITAGVKEVVTNANEAMLDLRKELEARPEGPFNPDRATRIAAMLGNLSDAAHELGKASDHISTITDAKGSVTVAFDKFSALSADLMADDRPFLSTFSDLKKTSAEARVNLSRTAKIFDNLGPVLERTTGNAEQMLDTLKREPWRIIWKSTKQYDDAVARNAAPVAPSPTPRPTVRRNRTRLSSRDLGL